ncbi:hypothetical protein V8G56_16065 [Gaetbulibacter aquiaggeris]|uniref:Uncharacterized protein n=1 Tax=Gaetbulibacter aquiaggeris TaxID=1735373 RepID=A0ABW7MTX4_9FLAO
MPYQNKVDPWGQINAVKSRGMFLGNRGMLHNTSKEIVSVHKIKGWVTCLLEFKGRKREIMAPNTYTELFFLDEATAFSAGHRPCAECRRERYNEFKEKWLSANSHLLEGNKPTIANIDKVIHQERLHKKEKITYSTNFGALPDGTMIRRDSNAYLIWKNKLYLWTFSGYSLADIKIEKNDVVKVLTPKSYVKMFSNNFVPIIHDSI